MIYMQLGRDDDDEDITVAEQIIRVKLKVKIMLWSLRLLLSKIVATSL